MGEFLGTIAGYITSLGVITGAITWAISKVFDVKLRPIHNRDRMQLRYEIVGFASDLHKGKAHTRDEFLAIFEIIDEYKLICEQLDIKNHVFEEECKYIDNCFQNLDILEKGKDTIEK